MPDDQTQDLLQVLLNEKETETLILALARGRAQAKTKQTFTEDEATKVYNDARLIRLQALYLTLALEGRINVDLDEDGHIVWVWPNEEEKQP